MNRLGKGARTHGLTVYLGLVGLALLGVSWAAVLRGRDATGASLGALAGAALLLAPFASRLQGTLKVGPIEMTLREQVLAAVDSAPPASLEGVLPLLESEEVTVRRFPLPKELAGRSLTDPQLAFLRQTLNVSVIAVLLPNETRWRAGGQISDLQLPEGAHLLVAGSPPSLEQLARLSTG